MSKTSRGLTHEETEGDTARGILGDSPDTPRSGAGMMRFIQSNCASQSRTPTRNP